MPRLSVVVPVYNVQEFLRPCLDSVAAQTFTDLEVVMVDDGSTDASASIAREYAERDPRFVLISQPNGGLSSARNTGTGAATGELLAFLDSDDELPANAYELLVGALDQTGSDFASGNVHRIRGTETVQSPFLRRTFRQTRLRTHVTRFRPLLADRTASNKVFRRAFWDRHGFRFPEGRLYEDIPVTMPAHFAADAVDVIAEPVYHWRVRSGGGPSITQQRTELRHLRDRMTSLEEVSRFLTTKGPRGAKRWYDEHVVADDLRYYLNVLDAADDDYRALFLERVNHFLDGAADGVFDDLEAIERLKWHLVRRRLMPELLEVLRFQKEDLPTTPPVRVRRHWYGDYPFRADPRLQIPESVFRLDRELTVAAAVEELRREGDGLRVRGFAYIQGIGAPSRDGQEVELSLLPPGPLQRLRLAATAVRARTTPVERPELTAMSGQALSDVSWAGFEAVLDPGRLRRLGRRREGTWDLYVTVRAAGVKRRLSRFPYRWRTPLQAAAVPAGAVLTATAAHAADRRVTVDLRRQAASLVAARAFDDEALELLAELAVAPQGAAALEFRDEQAGLRVRVPLRPDGDGPGGALRARVRLDRLRPRASSDEDEDDEFDEAKAEAEAGSAWDVWIVEGGRCTPLMPPASGLPETPVAVGARDVLVRTGGRSATVVVWEPPAVVTAAHWTADGELELRGRLPRGAGAGEIVLLHRDSGERHAFGAEPAGADGEVRARVTPGRAPTLAGDLPLQEGTWQLAAAVPGRGHAPVVVTGPLAADLALAGRAGPRRLELAARRNGELVLLVGRDLDDDERGRYHQARLRRTAYATARRAPLRDAVVFSSFRGRQFSDSPRAIHEELVRRGAPLEHLWVVRDGACHVPPTATVLREGSREYHEALGHARFVVVNDHFPHWFERRDEQTCLQTWHGTPLKRLGFDVSDFRSAVRRFERGWARQVRNWQYVLSPNPFSTPILRRAYAVEGEMLETGYPRVDLLARADRDEHGRRIRERLGIPPDKRVVLYAPTYRDHVVDRRHRYRLDLRLDLDRLRAAVGEDTVILFRKHHYVVDRAPETADGFVRDVSAYPDGTELMLAADVLVTDYSSMIVDFANTGRPILLFTYDLDQYADEIRGFYLDFVGTVPAPLLRTTDEVAAALQDLDGVRARHAERYAAFRRAFCALDDGHAAARVVDRVFGDLAAR